jgi:hypothetical protein
MLENILFSNDVFTAESYREARLLYDTLIAYKEDKDKWLSLPKPFIQLIDSCLHQLENRFAELDKPLTSYQSPYFERISEKQHWDKRTKAYKYIL